MENFGGNYCYKITMEICTLEEIWVTLEKMHFGVNQ